MLLKKDCFYVFCFHNNTNKCLLLTNPKIGGKSRCALKAHTSTRSYQLKNKIEKINLITKYFIDFFLYSTNRFFKLEFSKFDIVECICSISICNLIKPLINHMSSRNCIPYFQLFSFFT